MHHDHDSVYTSDDWVRRLLIGCRTRCLGRETTPRWSNGRFKGENHDLLLEAETLEQLVALVAVRIEHYNSKRRHSSIGNVPPRTYVQRQLVEE